MCILKYMQQNSATTIIENTNVVITYFTGTGLFVTVTRTVEENHQYTTINVCIRVRAQCKSPNVDHLVSFSAVTFVSSYYNETFNTNLQHAYSVPGVIQHLDGSQWLQFSKHILMSS